jgi:hypothetical protein
VIELPILIFHNDEIRPVAHLAPLPIDAISDVPSAEPSLLRESDTVQSPLGDTREDLITRAIRGVRRVRPYDVTFPVQPESVDRGHSFSRSARRASPLAFSLA